MEYHIWVKDPNHYSPIFFISVYLQMVFQFFYLPLNYKIDFWRKEIYNELRNNDRIKLKKISNQYSISWLGAYGIIFGIYCTFRLFCDLITKPFPSVIKVILATGLYWLYLVRINQTHTISYIMTLGAQMHKLIKV